MLKQAASQRARFSRCALRLYDKRLLCLHMQAQMMRVCFMIHILVLTSDIVTVHTMAAKRTPAVVRLPHASRLIAALPAGRSPRRIQPALIGAVTVSLPFNSPAMIAGPTVS